MFKCCDCGSEYKIKPDFCDCGNDVFEEIIKESPKQKVLQEAPVKHKKTFSEQYPGLSKFMETLDPISVIIFILCIVLSISSFIFIKPKEDITQEKLQEEQKTERKVADINTFWNDAPPKQESKIVKKENNTTEELVNQIMNIFPITEEPKTTENKTVQKPQTVTQTQNNKPQTQIKSVQKTQSVQKAAKPAAKTQPKTKQQTTTITTNTVKKTTQNQQQTKSNNVVQPQQQKSSAKPTQNVQQLPQTNTQIQTQIKPIDTTILKQQEEQELKNFKKGIQSVLASKIKGNLLQVYGDGSCVVDFKVDSNGKFINRSFSQQSTNNTLNDAVYQAVMATPSYKTPPSAYKGQTLHLSVKITNGVAQIYVY